jgi:hypothetical protein
MTPEQHAQQLANSLAKLLDLIGDSSRYSADPSIECDEAARALDQWIAHNAPRPVQASLL